MVPPDLPDCIEAVLGRDTGLGCLTYHDKNDKGTLLSGSSLQSYAQEKQNYIESHGKVWTPSNKRPDKLRDHIKEFEDSLACASNVFSWWKTEELLQILLSNGTVYWVSVDQGHGDITKLTKDTSLVGRITLSSVCDAVFTSTFIALCSSDTAKLEVIYFTKGALVDNSHKKLSTLEPKVYSLDLPGRPGRSLSRQIQVSPAADALLIYWPIASEEAWPWAPMSNEEERANLCIVSLVGGKPSIVAYTKTESDPLDVRFNCEDSTKLQSVERSVNAKNPRADLCVYELTKSCIHRTHHNTVSLASTLTGASWDTVKNNLVLSCEDNSLVLYSENLKNTTTVRLDFHADFIQWHPSNALLLVINHKGDVQLFDKALSCLNLTLEGVEFVPHIKLSNFFRLSPRVKSASWCSHSNHQPGQSQSTRNTLLIAFDRGPIGLMRFVGGDLANADISCPMLVTEYLKSRHYPEATKLLTAMGWDSEGEDCFQCLVNIMNTLLRQPLNKLNEDLLEATLGCFYAPQKALAEIVILEYRVYIGYLARRFFHHLVRYSRFDKAFLLAVDINARDLFMDIYYAALDSGQHRLAAAAKHKAKLCDDELMFSDSGSSVNDADILTDEDIYSGASSDDSLVDSKERAEAIVRARVNGYPPPLPPRKLSNKITPPVPPRSAKNGSIGTLSLHKTPSSGESTPPLPPRAKQPPISPQHIQRQQGEAGDIYGKSNGQAKNANKYHHMTGCTLPSGYTYDLTPQVSQRIIDDFNSMVIDEALDYNQSPDGLKSSNQMDRKPVKVIHFGLV